VFAFLFPILKKNIPELLGDDLGLAGSQFLEKVQGKFHEELMRESLCFYPTWQLIPLSSSRNHPALASLPLAHSS
jgi:hypothetical protein